MVRMMTLDEFLQKAIERYGEFYDYSKVIWRGTKYNVIIVCPYHGEFSQRPSRHLEAIYGCPGCGFDNKERKAGSKSLAERGRDFVTRATAKYNGKFDYSRVDYRGHDIHVEIVCIDHGSFKQTPTTHLGNSIHGCSKCADVVGGELHKLTTEEFIQKGTETHGNRYDYSKSAYVSSKDKLIIICRKHGEFLQLPTNHYKYGCEQCADDERLVYVDEFMERVHEKHGNMYDYSKTKYRILSEMITIICPEHGEFRQLAGSHMDGAGCPHHKGSRGVLIISKWLNDNNIPFVREYRFADCRNVYPLPFDFYIPSMNALIEYDGEQHFRPIDYYGGEGGFAQRQFNDAIKNNYATRENIPLLRIRFDLPTGLFDSALIEFVMGL